MSNRHAISMITVAITTIVCGPPVVAAETDSHADRHYASATSLEVSLRYDASRPLIAPPTDESDLEPWLRALSSDERILYGNYFRLSGLYLEQQNDGRRIATGEPIGFDGGGGFSLAFGHRFATVPLSLEVEYTFRSLNTDGPAGDGRLELHTLTANVMLDMPDVVGPVGFYTGIGVGAGIDSFSFHSSMGMSETTIEGDGFYWQARGGITITVAERTQIFMGAHWSDGGTIDDDGLEVDAQMFGVEAGFRIFF